MRKEPLKARADKAVYGTRPSWAVPKRFPVPESRGISCLLLHDLEAQCIHLLQPACPDLTCPDSGSVLGSIPGVKGGGK